MVFGENDNGRFQGRNGLKQILFFSIEFGQLLFTDGRCLVQGLLVLCNLGFQILDFSV